MNTYVDAIRPCPVCGEDQPENFRLYFDGYIKLFRCVRCGMVAQYPGPGKNTLIVQYEDEFSLDFLNAGKEFYWPGHAQSFNDIAERIRRFAEPGRLLDVGCGDGHFLSHCKRHGFDCFGIEPGIKMSQYARHKTGAKIVNGYYGWNTFPPNSFDVITMIQVLEHIISPRDFLTAAYRQLRPGGIIAIEVPSVHAPHFLLYQTTGIQYFVRPPRGIIAPHVNYFSPATLEILLQQIGFRTQELVTGRWRLRKSGWLNQVAHVADVFLNHLKIGGILCIAEKV